MQLSLTGKRQVPTPAPLLACTGDRHHQSVRHSFPMNLASSLNLSQYRSSYEKNGAGSVQEAGSHLPSCVLTISVFLCLRLTCCHPHDDLPRYALLSPLLQVGEKRGSVVGSQSHGHQSHRVPQPMFPILLPLPLPSLFILKATNSS